MALRYSRLVGLTFGLTQKLVLACCGAALAEASFSLIHRARLWRGDLRRASTPSEHPSFRLHAYRHQAVWRFSQ
jgi:hypothetical protein